MLRFCLPGIGAAFLACACSSNDAPFVPPDIPLVDGPGELDVGDGAEELDLPEVPDVGPVLFDDADELLVRIASPSPMPSFAVSDGDLAGTVKPSVVLAGVVFGKCDALHVETQDGAVADVEIPEEERASPFRYFSLPPVAVRGPVETSGVLEARATRVWVRAVRGEKSATATVSVAANPGFLFPARLAVTPDVVFDGEPTDVIFTLDLNRVDNFDAASVVLMETDAQCGEKVEGSAKLMVDDGQTETSADEIAQDRVYTKLYRIEGGGPGIRMFRAALKAKVGTGELVAYTPCIAVQVVARVSEASCSVAQEVLKAARGLMDEAIKKGKGIAMAKIDAVSYLRGNGSVQEAGAAADGDVVWVHFKSGLLGAVEPTDEVGAVAPATVLYSEGVGEPPAARTVLPSRLTAAAVAGDGPWSKLVAETDCPPLMPAGGKSSLATMRQLAEAGITVLAGRGGVAFGGVSAALRAQRGFASGTDPTAGPVWTGWNHAGAQEVVWLEEELECGKLASSTTSCYVKPDGECCLDCSKDPPSLCPGSQECLLTHGSPNGVPIGYLYDRREADLAAGRLVMGPEGLGLLPAFVARYAGGDAGGNVVFLGFSHSLSAGAMAAEWLAAGADSVVGTVDATGPAAGQQSAAALVGQLIDSGRGPLELVPLLGSSFADYQWRLVGGGQADLTYAGPLNLRFEDGTLKGWAHTGDARVLAHWCGEAPTGAFFALLSTGIGHTVQTGELSQYLCVPEDSLLFSGYFEMVSHEFLDSCGSPAYSDRLDIVLEDEFGQTIPVAVSPSADFVDVNALCPCDAAECDPCVECGSASCECGTMFQPAAGKELTEWPAECGFDNGDAWQSGWRELAEGGGVNISAFAGLKRPVKLTVRVRDAGDSKGDTTVLLDGMMMQ